MSTMRARIKAALTPFDISEAVELDGALPDTDSAEAADPPRIAQQFAFDAEALFPVLVDDHPRTAFTEGRVHILFPQREPGDRSPSRLGGLFGR
jgi:hypothetical protein